MENTKKKFPQEVRFIEWSSAVRELNPVRDLRAFKELLRILRPFREDDTVIHLHSSKAGFLGRAACGILGISAVIYTPHGASFIRTDTGKLKRSFFRLLERVGGFFGGTVVGCGPSEAALYSGLGKPALWIANGVPITPARKDPVSGLTVFTGIATAQKDPAFFNRVAEALSGVKEAAFCWVGDGPLRDSLRAGNIKVTGWQDRRTVEDYLSRALVYFSASAWEGLPYGVLEAMNASCALLLRNVPGNRELVIPGENGRLFDTEEEAAALLAEMLKNRQKTLDMGARSRLLAESRYSAVLMGEKYRDLYKAVSAGDISHLVPSGNHASCGAA